MRITRRHTRQGKSPYPGEAGSADFCQPSTGTIIDRETPDALVVLGLRPDGIAACLRPVPEDDVPQWVWRHVPDESALAAMPESDRYRGETDLRQVIDRIVGAWTYHGWKGGYFDSEQDARAFFDEVRWLLWQRRLSPSMGQWRNTGLYWAYGLSTVEDGAFVTDYRSGALRRAGVEDTALDGGFINGVHDSLAGDGGVWDLWRREASILQNSGTCGVNVSGLCDAEAGKGATDLASLLAVGDAATRTTHRLSVAGTTRRITVDAKHDNARAVLRRAGDEASRRAADETGRTLVRRHIACIIDACQGRPASTATDPEANPALRMAIRSARQALLPDSLIERTLALLRQGEKLDVADLAGAEDGPAAENDGAVTVLRVDDATLQEASGPIDEAARCAWISGTTGLLYETVSQAWNGCRDSGEIRSASGDGAFLFLDDTASGYAVLNAAAFLAQDGAFDTKGFSHAVELAATALDISLMTAALPTPRLARRVWDFRPIALSVAGLGDLLMAHGIPYDSDKARATGAALCALMTGTAYLNAARLAAEMGPFPAWPENAAAMQRTVRHHGEAADGIPGLVAADLLDAARRAWKAADDGGACHGYRNAYVSHIAEAAAEAAWLGCATCGIEPVPSLVRYEQLPAGGWRRTIEPAVSHGLRALGYGAALIDRMLRHVLGHATLDRAPGVNHETLRKRGFTENAIKTVEAALPMASDLGSVFSVSVLGHAYCRRMLGFGPAELDDEDFDMLAALGFSDAGVEAANLYCFGAGTLEGAPHLDPDHLPLFDCATPQGERGRREVAAAGMLRMMAAAQPMITGAIGQSLTLPAGASMAECRAAFRLGWKLGLKSLTIRRREPDHAGIPLREEGYELPRETSARLSLVENGPAQAPVSSGFGPGSRSSSSMSQALAIAHTARAMAGETSRDGASAPNIRTDVAEAGETAARDAEASRHTASLVARSTASVPSSADAVVEQRQV